VVADERVALWIAGDPDLTKPMSHLGHRLQEGCGTVERPGRLVDVARDDEYLVDSQRLDLSKQLRELAPPRDQPRRQVGDDRVPVVRQTRSEPQRCLDPAGGGGRDRDRQLTRDPLEHGLLDSVERYDLQTRAPEKAGQD